MNKNLIRVGGITAVLGGVYLLLLATMQVFYNGDFLEDFPLIAQTIALMPLFLLLGAVGLYTLANGRPGVQAGAIITALGAALMTIGFALMVWFDNENGWSIMFFGMIIMPIGLLIFGTLNWKAEILSRWNKIPLIFGATSTVLILLGTLDLFAQQQSEYFFAIFLLVLAGGWVGIGVAMVVGDSETAIPKTTAVP